MKICCKPLLALSLLSATSISYAIAPESAPLEYVEPTVATELTQPVAPIATELKTDGIKKVAFLDKAAQGNDAAKLEFTEEDKAKLAEANEKKADAPVAVQPRLTVDQNLTPQQLEKYRETGEHKGWRIFFDNHVDSSSKAIASAKANTYIATLIQQLDGEEEQKKIEKPLIHLADYLNLLYPELDIADTPHLNQYQTDILFNLAFEVQAKRREDNDEKISIEELLPSITDIQDKIVLFYQQRSQCAVNVNISRPDMHGNIIALTISASATQTVSDCSDKPEIVEFQHETLWVNTVILNNDTQMASFGINKEDIKRMLELERQEKTAYMVNGIKGFAQVDLISLADQISYLYYTSKGGQLTNVQLSELTQHVMKLREGRGMTFDELQSIADEVKAYYRGKGLILANVFIPEQDFKYALGKVHLQLSPGVLGSVEVRGIENMHYKKAAILKAFEPYIGKNVSEDVSDAYFLINSLPGLSVQSGLFETGDKDGETKLVLDVKESAGSFTITADNYGTELTGESRFMIAGDWLNPSGNGDVLSAGYLRTGDPSISNLGFVNYQLPIIDAKTSMALSFDTNLYEAQRAFAGENILIVEGKTYTFLAGLNRKLTSSKDFNMSAGWNMSYKRADTESQLIIDDSIFPIADGEEETIGTMFMGHADFLSPALRSVFSMDASLAYGATSFASRDDDDFIKINFNSNTNTLIAFSSKVRSKLSTVVRMSLTNDTLPTYEQFSLGGPYAVKAFSSSAFVADKGVFIGAEWAIDIFDTLPWASFTKNNSLDIGVFYEEAYGTLNMLPGDDRASWANISGYGLVARYEWRRSFVIDSSLSWPGKTKEGGTVGLADQGEDSKFLLSLRYQFD